MTEQTLDGLKPSAKKKLSNLVTSQFAKKLLKNGESNPNLKKEKDNLKIKCGHGGMADTRVSKTLGEIREGSSPSARTNFKRVGG